MDAGQIKRDVIRELEENSVAIQALIDPPFKLQEVFDVITEAIELIEKIAPDGTPGVVKRAIAEGMIEWLDKKFKITATIVSMVLPRGLRWLPIKWIVRKIFPAMIDVIVRLLNKYVWKKED